MVDVLADIIDEADNDEVGVIAEMMPKKFKTFLSELGRILSTGRKLFCCYS